MKFDKNIIVQIHHSEWESVLVLYEYKTKTDLWIWQILLPMNEIKKNFSVTSNISIENWCRILTIRNVFISSRDILPTVHCDSFNNFRSCHVIQFEIWTSILMNLTWWSCSVFCVNLCVWIGIDDWKTCSFFSSTFSVEIEKS